MADQVAAVVEALPREFRCHEVARAVGKLLSVPVVDGHHGTVEHSWCVVDERIILDVWCVGRLPRVQLVDPAAVTGHAVLYREGPERSDIDSAVVDQLLKRFTEELRESEEPVLVVSKVIGGEQTDNVVFLVAADAYEDPRAFGVLLAEAVQQVANAYGKSGGFHVPSTVGEIRRALEEALRELNIPVNNVEA